MRIAPDIIVHQSAIVDDGKKLANRNKRVQLVEPFDKMDSDGQMKQISSRSIHKLYGCAEHPGQGTDLKRGINLGVQEKITEFAVFCVYL